MSKETYEYIIPEYAANYFANGLGDETDEELELINKFEQKLIKQFGHAFISIDEELGFKSYNDIDGLGSNCYLGIILH